MCSAIGAFMVSDFSLGVILRQCKECKDDSNSNGLLRLQPKLGEASLAWIDCAAVSFVTAEASLRTPRNASWHYDAVRLAKAIPISSTVTMMHSQENQSPNRA